MAPIVYLHGAGLDAGIWAPFQERLGGVALDLPGRGGGGGPCGSIVEMAASISAKIPENAVVVGHSMGGAVALELALARPLAGLVLMATGARLRVNPVVLEAVDSAAESGVMFRFVPGLFSAAAPEVLVELFATREAAVPVSTVQADWRAVDRFDRRADIQAFPPDPPYRRALILSGDTDVLTPPRYATWLAEHLPRSRVQEFTGGHLVAWERLDEVAAAIQAWLAEGDADAGGEHGPEGASGAPVS